MSDYGGSLGREVAHALLGRRVRVRIDDAGEHVIVGRLLKLTEDGEVDVLLDDGRTSYAWPALDVTAEP